MDPSEEDLGPGPNRPKFGFRIYENFRNIVKKSRSNYDLSEAHCPTYEDVEVTGSHALSSLDSCMTTDSLNVIRNDGNATDDSGIDSSIDQQNSSPEPHVLRLNKDPKTPIYSSVVKKKSNPARDFALTVLEQNQNKTETSCDLSEISKLLNSTNLLLSRNSNLRASLTIRVQRSNKTTELVEIPLNDEPKKSPSPSLDRKDSTSGDSGNASGSASDDKCSSEEESCESTLPSLEPHPFIRSNPARRPVHGGHTMEVRRSIRLAPKTVANLASKFDNFKGQDKSSSSNSTVNRLGKKDITKIITALEKLDEDAKQASLVLQKNHIKKSKDHIDNLMKTTKSSLEEVELPSQPQKDLDLEPEVVQESESTKSCLTDKYLQTLQKIAKDNAETGQFRTALPKEMSIGKDYLNPDSNNRPAKEENNAHLNDENFEKDDISCTSSPSSPSSSSSDENYDTVEPPKDLLVTARPAIVTEDQFDSLSFYDDAGAPSLGGDLYESIAGSLLNLAKRNSSSIEDMYSSVLYSPQKVQNSLILPIFHFDFTRFFFRLFAVSGKPGKRQLNNELD